MPTDPVPDPQDEASFTLGPYEVFNELGAGGMGTVYRARHRKLKHPVALKVMDAKSSEVTRALERFQREASILAHLDHPGIVRVLEFGEDGGTHYIAMELVEGQDLRSFLDEHRQGLEPALRLMVAIAQAVGHAHQRGFIHRDLKPANILLDGQGRPRITDFGLGRALGSHTQLTRTQQVMGTPQYLAPESLRAGAAGSSALGPEADVFSLGVIMYEMLTYKLPFDAPTAIELFRDIVEADPIPPRRLNMAIPLAVETVCLKALRKQPSERYVDAQELADDIDRLLRFEAVHARPEATRHRAFRWMRRHRIITGVGLGATLGIAAWLSARAAERWDAGRSAQLRRAAGIERVQAARRASDLEAALRIQTQLRGEFPQDRELRSGRRALLLELGDQRLRAGELDLAAWFFHEVEAEGDAIAAARGLEQVEHRRGARGRAIQACIGRIAAEAAGAGAAGRPVSEDQLSGWVLDLVALRGADTVTSILHASADEEALRQVFARALGAMGDARAVQPLIDWARDGHAPLVVACVHALSRLGGPEARAAVLEIYQARPELQARLRGALGRFDADGAPGKPPDVEAWLERGLVQWSAGRMLEALESFAAALELDPDNVSAHINRGAIFAEAGRQAEALQHFTAALRLQPANILLRHNLASTYMQLGRLPEALRTIDALLQTQPLFVLAHFTRGKILVRLGRTAEALESFGRCVTLEPGFAMAYQERAKLWQALKRLPQALADFDEALRQAPEDAGIYSDRGNLLKEMGHLDRAQVDYEEAVRRAPTVAGFVYNLGSLQLQLQRLDAALKSFDSAIRLDPAYADAHSMRGATHILLGRYQEALADLDRSLGLDPRHAPALQNRATAHECLGRFDLALADLQTLLSLASGEAQRHHVQEMIRRIQARQASDR